MSLYTDQHVVAIVQARMGSVRLPGKVVSPVLEKPVLEHLIERLSRAELVDQVVLAVPDTAVNDELSILADRLGVTCFRGSETNVLDRFGLAADSTDAQVIVRITGDCPLVAPELVDRVLSELATKQYDYLRTGQSFPDGLDVEAFTIEALQRARMEAIEPYDREHVTPYMQRDPDTHASVLEAAQAVPDERVTLDEPEDLEVIGAVFDFFGHNRFSFEDVAELMRSEPSVFAGNRHLGRDGGASMGTGEKLWKRAKRVIPGGNMLLSKRAEMHLPAGWPSYFSRAKGCRVWDLDDRMYVDVGLMGVGTNKQSAGCPSPSPRGTCDFLNPAPVPLRSWFQCACWKMRSSVAGSSAALAARMAVCLAFNAKCRSYSSSIRANSSGGGSQIFLVRMSCG